MAAEVAMAISDTVNAAISMDNPVASTVSPAVSGLGALETQPSAVQLAMQQQQQASASTPEENPSNDTFAAAAFITPLKDLCVEVVAKEFRNRPTFGKLSKQYIEKVVSLLDIELPLDIVGQLISDENYWRRRSTKRWRNLEVSQHGGSWKQLYFERNLAEALEKFDPNAGGDLGDRADDEVDDLEGLRRLIDFSSKYVHSLVLKQLPSHLDLQVVLSTLHTSLISLSLTYGMSSVGMDYDRSLFGMKLADCRSLAKSLERCETLIHINLSNNLLDDDKVRMITSGLIDNMSVTHLDLSHNKIADRGARALSKLLDSRSVLVNLELQDNEIHSEGARALAKGLRQNSSLLRLNLRLNRMGDEGGRAIFDALKLKHKLIHLNVSSNSLSNFSSVACAGMLVCNQNLKALDMSCNIVGEAGKQIRDALLENSGLVELDTRMCGIEEELEDAISHILALRKEDAATTSQSASATATFATPAGTASISAAG